MFEPPLVSQLLGTGTVILGFIGAGLLARQMDKQEEEERRLQEEYDTQVVRACNELLEMGREIEREQIRKNIRREFKGFTFDNEPPVGLRPEPLALPEPRRSRHAKYLG
ncbi:hypothetical protein SPSSI3_10825 [Streptococcus pseudopneumoniae]|uniref:hypothetical protein n=1 Tax=Streptococcus pseudopneumoniae TaxID=257758 RepID=UPI0006C8960A|nr:hypothetical protein [Streptococcus pseudopneumoniae]KPL38516.1 hypothetical protein SPSSI3_10825 [Streptococcus pseudopneumoniae]